MSLKQHKTVTVVLLLTLACYLFFALAVPYSVTDDMQWGMEQGVRWWLGGLLNSRYVGNFFAVIMGHSPIVKTLVMGGSMFALPLFMTLLSVKWDDQIFLPFFLVCNVGILLMPGKMWLETYGWVSGFGNYVIPSVLFLLWLLIVRHVHQIKSRRILWSVILFFLSLGMGLFVENLTIFFLFVSLMGSLYALWETELRLPLWFSLAGSLLAVFIMFLNGLFSDLAQTGAALSGLRTLTFSLDDGLWPALCSMMDWYFFRLLPIAFLRGCHMAVPMAVITACAFWHSRLRPLTVLGLVPLITNYLLLNTENLRTPLFLTMSTISWALPLVALLVQDSPFQKKCKLVLLFLAAPLSLAPMAAVQTLGQRLYFFPTAILVMVAANALIPLLSHRSVRICIAGLGVALMVAWGSGQLTLLRCTNLRAQLMDEAIQTNQQTLILPVDRFEYTLWTTRNPWDVEFADYFRQFHHIPDDMTLIFLPTGSFELWPEISAEHWENRKALAPSKDYTSILP